MLNKDILQRDAPGQPYVSLQVGFQVSVKVTLIELLPQDVSGRTEICKGRATDLDRISSSLR